MEYSVGDLVECQLKEDERNYGRSFLGEIVGIDPRQKEVRYLVETRDGAKGWVKEEEIEKKIR